MGRPHYHQRRFLCGTRAGIAIVDLRHFSMDTLGAHPLGFIHSRIAQSCCINHLWNDVLVGCRSDLAFF